MMLISEYAEYYYTHEQRQRLMKSGLITWGNMIRVDRDDIIIKLGECNLGRVHSLTKRGVICTDENEMMRYTSLLKNRR